MTKKKTIWVGQWSNTVVSVRDLAKTLRGEGINVRTTDTSPFSGHRVLEVDKDDLDKAKKVLRQLGRNYVADECFDE